MTGDSSHENVDALVRAWDDEYGTGVKSLAWFLCDHHPPGRIAYRIIASDLSATDVTYGALKEDSERFAAALVSLGAGPGDRVATLMGKSRDLLVAVLGIWRLGAVHVPLFTAFAPPAIGLRLGASAAKIVIADGGQLPKLLSDPEIVQGRTIVTTAANGAVPTAVGFAELLSRHAPGFPAATLDGGAPFIQIYTSGTTGTPKGVVVPIRALASFRAYAVFGLDLRDDDMFWNAADPGWAYGLYYGIVASFATGVTSLLFEGGAGAAAIFAILSRYGVTNFAAAPTVYRLLRTSNLSAPGTISLRCASSAGEPLTPDVNLWAASALGVEVYDHYGQTETGMVINNHHHPALRRPLKPGSMGRTMPGWGAAILKTDADTPAPAGEMGRVAFDLTASPLVWFRGYADDPERSAEKFSADGRWYVTGDVGRLEDDGYFYFMSRDDDVIIMAGYRIGPFEVESVLVSHRAVRECAVVAVPDAVRGEVLEAVVVLQEGHVGDAMLTGELQSWIRTRYAAHAYPRRIHYASELPRTPSGKVQRFVLRQQLKSGMD